VLYRYTNIPNFNQPFADQHNFGNFIDLVLMNKINKGGWVAINCLPTAVHTIAGALVGKILLQDKKPLSSIFMASVCCLVVGYGLDLFDITPIIKRIATTSFTLASLGYCLAALGACFWWIDVKKHQTNWEFFTIVGMNSIFIYLFFEIVGHRWFNGYVEQITTGLLLPLQLNELQQQVVSALAIFGLEWGMCYFLYRKKIFFKV
jgi:predicted acyltransferase